MAIKGLNQIHGPLLAFFTLALVMVGILQWCTLEKTDQTLKTQKRAWLAPGSINLPENFKAPNPEKKSAEIILNYENVGEEPAIETNILVWVDTIDINAYGSKDILEEKIRNVTGGRSCGTRQINPRGSAVYQRVRHGAASAISADQVDKVVNLKDYTLVLGCFVYKTVGETHWSEYCGILQAVDRNRQVWHSLTCPIHNRAN